MPNNKKTLRYENVITMITQYIHDQQLPPEHRLPSEREFGEMWQISQPTINKAVACLLAQGLLRRDGYRLFVASGLSDPVRSEPIYVLCPHVEYQQSTLVRHNLVEAAHDVANVVHGNFIPLLAKNTSEQRQQLLRLLRSDIKGFVIWPLSRTSLNDLFAQFAQRRVPFVVCDDDSGPDDYVGIDNEAGARLAVAHLVECGHRELAYVTDSLSIPTLRRRCHGYEESCFAHELKHSISRVVAVKLIDLQQATHALDLLISKHPQATALFCSNDLLAIHLMEAARNRGIVIPEQLSILGFDDIDASAITSPTLTTISQDFYGLGVLAMEALYRRLNSSATSNELPRPYRVRLEPRLVIRNSVAQRTKRNMRKP